MSKQGPEFAAFVAGVTAYVGERRPAGNYTEIARCSSASTALEIANALNKAHESDARVVPIEEK